MLHRFWILFQNPPKFSAVQLGCGITAFDKEDVVKILTEQIFPKFGLMQVDTIVKDVDFQELDLLHVIPNMGNIVKRGVWFPLL